MTQTSDARRTGNLLGAFGLAVAERIQAASDAGTGRPATDTAALLLLLTTLDGTTQEGLAKSLALTESGATRLVDRLVREGLVRREPGPNRRTFAIATTPAGQDAGRRALTERASACAVLLDALDVSEQRVLGGLLDKLLHALPTSRREGHRICRLCDPEACGHGQGRCPVTQGVDAVEQSG